MPKLYTSFILLINQSKEIDEKQFSVFVSRGGQNSPLLHVPLCNRKLTLGTAERPSCTSVRGHLVKMPITFEPHDILLF